MKCPHCDTPLVTRNYESDVHVDECPTCGGMWLEKSELERIEETVKNYYADELLQPDDSVARSFEMARQRSRPPVNCPKCGRETERREAHATSLVLVDECPTCGGKWLDFGEAQSLEQFVERLRRERKGPQQFRPLAFLRGLFA